MTRSGSMCSLALYARDIWVSGSIPLKSTRVQYFVLLRSLESTHTSLLYRYWHRLYTDQKSYIGKPQIEKYITFCSIRVLPLWCIVHILCIDKLSSQPIAKPRTWVHLNATCMTTTMEQHIELISEIPQEFVEMELNIPHCPCGLRNGCS